MTAGYDQAQLLYLQHLGIDVWVPRDVPLHTSADESIDVHAPETEANVATPVAQDVATPLAAQQAASPAPIQSPVEKGVATLAQEPVINPVSAPAFPFTAAEPESVQAIPDSATNEPVPEFTLNYWCYRSGLWIVTAEVHLTPQHHAFVHNVAHALQGMKSKPKHVGMFVWPMLDAPNVDQGESVAKRYLAEHFEQLTAFVEPKHLVCFAHSEQWLTGLETTKIDLTLGEVMSSADSKRSLWQTLKPLSSLF